MAGIHDTFTVDDAKARALLARLGEPGAGQLMPRLVPPESCSRWRTEGVSTKRLRARCAGARPRPRRRTDELSMR